MRKGPRMTAAAELPPLYRRPGEIGRRLLGSGLELGFKAYGTAAVASVALSDAETVAGKGHDAVNAVPNLVERYREARYLVDHREQIQGVLDYVHEHAPAPDQLDAAARHSSQTLERLTTTYDELGRAWASLTGIRPTNVVENLPRAKEHFDTAWAARPDLDSIGRLAGQAREVTPLLRQLAGLDLDVARIYADLLSVTDNFAADELAGTLLTMGAVLAVAYLLGMAAGFWGRRGRPGFVAGALQALGARVFPAWYARNFEHALGRPVHAAARERIRRDIVADPRGALDPQSFHELEQYFERRSRGESAATSGSGAR